MEVAAAHAEPKPQDIAMGLSPCVKHKQACLVPAKKGAIVRSAPLACDVGQGGARGSCKRYFAALEHKQACLLCGG